MTRQSASVPKEKHWLGRVTELARSYICCLLLKIVLLPAVFLCIFVVRALFPITSGSTGRKTFRFSITAHSILLEMAVESSSGVTGGVDGSLPILITMCAFLAISFYNMIELVVIIYTTFKLRSGLYFWSFVAATTGFAPYGIGFTLKFFQLISIPWIPVAMVGIGLIGMVTGQSLVLYSRLHLIVRNAPRIRWVLYMIIFDAIVFHLPTMVMAFGADSSLSARFVPIFVVYDKIQLTVFFVQECIISGIYIYETVRLLAPTGEPVSASIRNLLKHLIIVNIFVLMLDSTVLAFGYSGYYQIQTTFKAAVYSVKLKVEFSVLNRLVGIVKNKALVLGDLGSGSTGAGTLVGQPPSDAWAGGDGSRHFGSVGSGATVVGHGGFVRIDRMNNTQKEEVMPRVAIREYVDEDATHAV